VAVIVDDLEKARHFDTDLLGLQELPALAFDYPVQFYQFNIGRCQSPACLN
jgi:catechol 2,3-dioxygenase-like lactoylglutathione lyase family enzyme